MKSEAGWSSAYTHDLQEKGSVASVRNDGSSWPAYL